MALKIIGAGFGRTGTMSLKAGLEQLGYFKTHHMIEVLPHTRQIKLWNDVGKGEPPAWDEIFDGFQACVDFPASTYYQELMVHYPEAKVILTVRDPQKWYQSTADTIYRFPQIVPKWAHLMVPRIRRINEMTHGTIWQRIFHGRFEDREYAKQVFVDYTEQVKNQVPANRLLVFEVKQGWAPLCAFLQCEIPDGPFPHVNDSVRMGKMIDRISLVFKAAPIVLGLALAGLIYGITRLF